WSGGSPGLRGSERRREVVRGEVQAVLQVEAVRRVALHTRVEVQLLAALPPRLRQEPVEELLAVAAEAHAGGGDEVVHVEESAPRQALADAKTGHRPDGSLLLEDGQSIAVVPLLTLDPRDELVLAQMRAQVGHQREAAEDVVARLEDANIAHLHLGEAA